MEQRMKVKFCYKLGKTAAEAHEMLVQAYGTEPMSRKWLTEDEPRSGLSLKSRNPDMIGDWWLRNWALARKQYASSYPNIWAQASRATENKMETSEDFITMNDQDPSFLPTIVTWDETWYYQFAFLFMTFFFLEAWVCTQQQSIPFFLINIFCPLFYFIISFHNSSMSSVSFRPREKQKLNGANNEPDREEKKTKIWRNKLQMAKEKQKNK